LSCGSKTTGARGRKTEVEETRNKAQHSKDAQSPEMVTQGSSHQRDIQVAEGEKGIGAANCGRIGKTRRSGWWSKDLRSENTKRLGGADQAFGGNTPQQEGKFERQKAWKRLN